MSATHCKLCSLTLNAPQQAVQHYRGKNHAKRVRHFVSSGRAAVSGAAELGAPAAISEAVDDDNNDDSHVSGVSCKLLLVTFYNAMAFRVSVCDVSRLFMSTYVPFPGFWCRRM